MQQAVVSHLHPVTASPSFRRSWLTRTSSPYVPRKSSARVRSTRNGSADSLDDLQRASKVCQQSHAPRRRVIQTTPFRLWDSFPEARTLDQMVRTMERIMEAEDGDGRVLVVPPASRSADNGVPTATSGCWRGRTPWEVREHDGEYLVRFDMPGMSREDVRVSVQDRTLVVVAEKASKADKEVAEAEENVEEAWPVVGFGRYRTRVELPENVEVERIAAEVKDGVLYLTIPKVSSAGKVVNIQVH